MNNLKIKVGISSDFLTSFANIPRTEQRKVTSFIENFKNNPTSSGINYEIIRGARDPNLRSVRIDLEYRGIVLKPEQGNVYLLLWVDKHDNAYNWALRKTCKINSETGCIQVFETDLQENEILAENNIDKLENLLFKNFKDKELLKLGLPEEFLPFIRKIKTEKDLEKLESKLPSDAYDSLYCLASGYSLEETYAELEKNKESENINTTDFALALENIDTKRHFYLIEDDVEFQAILNAPLEKWRIFLHPLQRRLVERDWKGSVKVLGGAGTGKTVVAMHRAKWLAENKFKEKTDKILFTTFTVNLSNDIKKSLKDLCSLDIYERIEVINLDKWVSKYLSSNGYSYKIIYDTDEIWRNALTYKPNEVDLPESFYKEEWKKVIQAQEIDTFAKYIKASRIGRGISLSRKEKKDIWPVFEEYILSLNEKGFKEPEDAMRDAYYLLKEKGELLTYKSIIVDEAQDMGMEAFKLIRQMIPNETQNDLFIVGDSHQKIYSKNVVLSKCGINIIGRSKKLKINYRTTDETRKWAVKILEGFSIDDLDGGLDNQKGYKSLLHGSEPLVKNFTTFEKEIEFIKACIQQIKKEEDTLDNTCLILRNKDLLEKYNRALNISTYLLTSESEETNKEGLRISTMHRIKGLEFNNIIIASVNDGIIPLKSFQTLDPIIKRESDLRERSLLYVSATRAKKKVIITSYGNKSEYLNIF